MLKIGILGVGHLGKIHLKCIQLADSKYEMVGFFDPDDRNAQQAVEEYGVRRFPDPESLIDAVDVVDIVTPTSTHFELASRAIRRGKHLFIEKPLTRTVEEAEMLIKLSRNYGVKVQVGHVERFNPALMALRGMPLQPMFIEAHRLANFNPRGTDVSVVLDLMIHDLDIILSMVRSPVREVRASGVTVVSNTPDISNARIEFANGCVANLTASRISLKQMRKVRLFQKDAYISLDFLEKQAQVIRLFEPGMVDIPEQGQSMELETPNGRKIIHMDMPVIEPTNAIKMELESLADSILADTKPTVSIEDGYKALELAYQILDDIRNREQTIG
jgi:predicted dehydrogenase